MGVKVSSNIFSKTAKRMQSPTFEDNPSDAIYKNGVQVSNFKY